MGTAPRQRPEEELELADAEEEAARSAAEPDVALRFAERTRGAIYRELDPTIQKERELHAAEKALVDRAIEDAILEQRRATRTAARQRALRTVALLALLVVGNVLVTYVLLDSVALSVAILLVTGVGWALVRGIDTIKPAPGRNQGGSSIHYPGSGLGG